MNSLLKKILIVLFIIISVFGVIVNLTLFDLFSSSPEFTVEISYNHETSGWNYTLTVHPSNFSDVRRVSINLSTLEDNIETLISSIELQKDIQDQKYFAILGVLPNGEYSIDLELEYIDGEVHLFEDVKSLSVGANE